MGQIKLIATDMDHTLLTEEGALPPEFENSLHALSELGILFLLPVGVHCILFANISLVLHPM